MLLAAPVGMVEVTRSVDRDTRCPGAGFWFAGTMIFCLPFLLRSHLPNAAYGMAMAQKRG